MATIPRPSVVHLADERLAIPLPEQVTIGLAAFNETVREGLLAFCVGVGLSVVAEIFEEEITQLVGPLVTHAVRMSVYNAESTLARLLSPHFSRADDEARALLREAFHVAGDLQVRNPVLEVRLNTLSAPRRTRALAALCEHLTATQTLYPATNLHMVFTVKTPPELA